MTLREELSTLKNLVKEITDDNTYYQDSFLYSIWKKARARVYKADSKKYISKWSWHRFCVELEEATNHNCGCIPQGCTAMVSVNKIPKAISSTKKDYVEATTLDGRTVGFTEEQNVKYDNLDPVKADKLRVSLYNQKLYVWNTNTLKYIQLNGLWEDITEWEDVRACNTDTDCDPIYDLDLGIGEAESEAILRICLELLQIPMSKIDDQNNNRNAEVRV
jgi:hypothetical protein